MMTTPQQHHPKPKQPQPQQTREQRCRDLARVFARLHPGQPPPSLIAPSFTAIEAAARRDAKMAARHRSRLSRPAPVDPVARREAKARRREAAERHRSRQTHIDAAFCAFERDATAWPTPDAHDFITAALDEDVPRELCDTRALFVELRAWALAAAAAAAAVAAPS